MASGNAGNPLQDQNDPDLSDVEDEEKLDLSPFQVDWLDLDFAGCPAKLGICGLPGCRYKSIWRSLKHDVENLVQMGVQEVFCFCTSGELKLYRVSCLLQEYKDAGISVHHYPVEDGHVPTMQDLMKIIQELKDYLMAGKNTVIHCYGGFGRSCAVAACLMMAMDPTLSFEDAKNKLQDLRGVRAIQSVKQYNFITEFRDLYNNYTEEEKKQNGESRSVSR